MQFTQPFFFVILFLTFGLVVSSAISNSIAKRDGNVTTILESLQDDIKPILHQIYSAINSESANDTSIGPLVDDLNNALNNTSSALNALEDRSESIDDIAGLAAPIVYDIVKAVAHLRTLVSRPILESVDASLTNLLNGLQGLLAGSFNLVADRLADVASLLHHLTFELTLSALGL